MSDMIRRLLGQASPNSDWMPSPLPHKPPEPRYTTDFDLPEVRVEDVPAIPNGEAPGAGTGRPLFEPRRRSNGIFRDPDSYDNRT